MQCDEKGTLPLQSLPCLTKIDNPSPIEGHSTKCLTSTPQYCQDHQKPTAKYNVISQWIPGTEKG